MAKTVEQVVKEADVLIKQERYGEAWKMLLPHKDDENARKRLKWLKSKQEQLKLEKEIAAAPVKKVKPNWFMGLGRRAKLFVSSVFLCSGCILFSMLGQTLGFIPDATERAATEIVRANETSAILTQNAPTATETITASATFTESPSATNSPAPSTTFTATFSETALPTSMESSNNARTGINNVSSAPSATFTPSPSLTPNPNELRFEDGNLSFVIQGFAIPPEVEDFPFVNGVGVVIFGTVENNGSGFDCVLGSDVTLLLDGEIYSPSDVQMALFQVNLNPYRDYLGLFGGHCVEGGKQSPSFAVFDVPLSVQTIAFRYKEDEKALDISWDALMFSDEELSLESLYVASTIEPTNAAIRATESLFATQTAIQWTATPSPRPTSTPPPTATEDNTILQEIQIEGIVRGLTDVDIQDVRIADGRANGGERSVIVSYNSSASNEFQLSAEWLSLFDAIDEAIDYHHIDLDAFSIIVGNQQGQATLVIAGSVDDLDAFINGRITSEQFFDRLSMTDL
jgi:hypothetical protein